LNIRSLFALRRWVGVALLLCVGLVSSACVSTPVDPTWAGISLVGDSQNILVTFEGNITLVNPTTGRLVELVGADGDVRVDDQGNPLLWNPASPDNHTSKFYTIPVFIDETWMLALSYTKKVFRINLEDGQIVNPSTAIELPGHVIADPVLNGDILYIGFAERNLSAYNVEQFSASPQTYEPLWTLETEHGIWAAPLLVEGVLYVPGMNHNLYALNAETGESIWTTDLQGAITSTPVYHEGNLYVGTLGRKVFEISAETGEILSEYTTQDWVWGSPVIVENTLYVGDMGGYVYALGIGDGALTEQWMQRPATMGIRATPIVFEDRVIVASRDTFIYWLNIADGSSVLDAEGNPMKRQVNGEILANMFVISPNDTLDIPTPLLIVSTMNRAELLVAFTLDTGQRQWVYGR
jgi:outer membrane protein assembly factor BamB